MNINKGMFRIYIVARVLWFAFFFFVFMEAGGYPFTDGSEEVLIIAILPLPAYYIIRWILKGFE